MVRDDEPTRPVAETKLQLPRTPWRSSRKIPYLVRFACGRFYVANYSFQSKAHTARAAPIPTVTVRTPLLRILPPGQQYTAALPPVLALPPGRATVATRNHSGLLAGLVLLTGMRGWKTDGLSPAVLANDSGLRRAQCRLGARESPVPAANWEREHPRTEPPPAPQPAWHSPFRRDPRCL